MRVLSALVAACCLWVNSLGVDGPISVGSTKIVNDYPEAVTFQVEVASTVAPIASVMFNVTLRGDTSTLVQPAEFAPGRQVVARYTWKTRRDNIPPGAPVQYSWAVRDEAGNTFTTQPVEYVITDSRFEWQVRQDADVAVWWYEGDAQFGQRVFDAATQAVAAMKQHTGASLAYRVHVVLYSNSTDFATWHNYVRDWVGGEAFSTTGLSVQIVPPRVSEAWIHEVIPHEIAHLFFYQITHNPLASGPPTWLNEGFAQYHESVPHTDELALVRQATHNGQLIPLRLVSGSFTGDKQRIASLYAESWSAVEFLFEAWGDAGMSRLLTAYKAGLNTDDALLRATGLNSEEFQQAWWDWLGGPAGMYPTPPPSAGLATARPPAERPTVPPISVTATPARSSSVRTPGPCCPCPGVGALGLLGGVAVWGQWHIGKTRQSQRSGELAG